MNVRKDKEHEYVTLTAEIDKLRENERKLIVEKERNHNEMQR